ncbi:serine/arginine repetitive matrix protein 2, partial [Butyricicoccus sp. 1XD8-22]
MKRFETFGEYMFDLLFAPLKKGRREINQFFIFFKVVGREFDRVKQAFFRVREESNVMTASEVMLPVHGQDRDMPRLPGETAEAYRTRLAMKGIISEWGGTKRGILYALTALGYEKSSI